MLNKKEFTKKKVKNMPFPKISLKIKMAGILA